MPLLKRGFPPLVQNGEIIATFAICFFAIVCQLAAISSFIFGEFCMHCEPSYMMNPSRYGLKYYRQDERPHGVRPMTRFPLLDARVPRAMLTSVANDQMGLTQDVL